VSVTLSPIRDDHGRVTGASVIARDIADRLRLEGDRARYVAALEEYNAVIAHDLADPTRTIAGLASWLEGRIGDELDDPAKRALDAICHAARRMETLIEGLRDYARLDALALDARPVELAAVVRSATDALRERLQEVSAEVHVGQLPEVDGDAMLLGQLFQNLIANAVKFRGERTPRVDIGAIRRNGDWVVAVADNGIGLDPSHADRVFGIYQRVHGEDRYEGAGVGLAVCRKIAERHGGRIWYEARPEGGTRFLVSLPAGG
jgi:light-regulated signal transduction histidine kinase (bacteriophytochrome)